MRACLADRAVLSFEGPDSRDLLQAVLTHDLGLLAQGRPLAAGLLSPQGKAEAMLILHDEGARLLADVSADRQGAILRRLTLLRLRRRVAIAPEPGLAVHVAWGEEMAGRPADPRLAAAGQRWLAPPEDPGDPGWAAHRIGLGLADDPEFDGLLWLEVNARELDMVSLSKGCFVGQENTARMHYRDKVRRRLVPLALAAPLPHGTPVLHQGRRVGELRGTGAAGPEGALQLAHLAVDSLGAQLEAGGAPASARPPAWLAAVLAAS